MHSAAAPVPEKPRAGEEAWRERRRRGLAPHCTEAWIPLSLGGRRLRRIQPSEQLDQEAASRARLHPALPLLTPSHFLALGLAVPLPPPAAACADH